MPSRPLKPLSEREERFCTAICKGLSRQAAFEEAGYSCGDTTAGWLLRRENITKRIAELRQNYVQAKSKARKRDLVTAEKAQETANLVAFATIDDHVQKLASIRDGAIGDRKWGDALDAEVKRGEVLGFYLKDKKPAIPELDAEAQKSALALALRKLQDHGVTLDKLDRQVNATVIEQVGNS